MIDLSTDVTGEHNGSYLKYLSFIQDVITRMNRNAFQLKGWSITIVAALVALAVNSGNYRLFFVAAISTVPFCFLDAYYLLMERQFRGLYEDVVNGHSDIKLFSLPINRYTKKEAQSDSDKKKYDYWRVIVSCTVLWFYGPMCLTCIMGWFLCNYCTMVCRNGYRDGFCRPRQRLVFSVPRYSEFRDKDYEVRKSGEESFRWEYKWK